MENLGECVVCYDDTNKKTKCNHLLCNVCMKKVKNICPCCRRFLTEIVNVETLKCNKNIYMRNLKRYVFSKQFKRKLELLYTNRLYKFKSYQFHFYKNIVLNMDKIISFNDLTLRDCFDYLLNVNKTDLLYNIVFEKMGEII